MKVIITENVIGILSALILFIITETIIRFLQSRKDKKVSEEQKIDELRNQYDELVIKIAVTLDNYAHYIGSPLHLTKDTSDRIFLNYDNATKEIRLLAIEFSTFRIKVKSDDLRLKINMPTFDEVQEIKRCLIGISNNMIFPQVDIDFERNSNAVSTIKKLLNINIER
jgi:hypothetical protein